MLFLDALFPPAPSQLVADCKAVGAAGCFAYVFRPGGIGNWTPAHVLALAESGLFSCPIIVPPVNGGDISTLIQAVKNFGFSGGPITLDLETPNLPPSGWEEQFDAAVAANGFIDFDYGNTTDLGKYQPDNDKWVAEWLRTGTLNPIPVLPSGWQGWQFVNDITINGSQYDASVIDTELFAGLTPSGNIGGIMDEATFKQWVRDVLNEAIGTGEVSWAGTVVATLAAIQSVFNQNTDAETKLQAIQQAISDLSAKIQVPAVDVSALATNLAGNPALLNAIAAQVVKTLAADLAKGVSA